jgi:hypothetical protein
LAVDYEDFCPSLGPDLDPTLEADMTKTVSEASAMRFHAFATKRVCRAFGGLIQVTVPLLLMVLTALAWALAAPTRAYAADAQIDSFTINYEMQPSGVLKVKETILWRFGSNSDRHGIHRDLIIREPDRNSDQDFVYGISDITVTSTDPGVATSSAQRQPSPKAVVRRS